MADTAFPTLVTERLNLREITHDDVDAMFAIHGDAELMKWFGDPVADRAATFELINMLAGWRKLADPGVRWGLERRNEPGLIGSCGLFGWQRRNRKCVIGYELAREAQGQGLMHEALVSAIEWGLEHMDLVRIEAQIHPANVASQAVVDKLGFECEGLARKVLFFDGEHQDLYIYSLVR